MQRPSTKAMTLMQDYNLMPKTPKLMDRVRFRGHPMVRSTHRSTLEVTMDDELTERGDCIIGVSADKGCLGLSERLKDIIHTRDARLRFVVRVEGLEYSFLAAGDPRLKLTHPHEIVVRKSAYVSDRTVALNAGASAADLPREIVARLKDPGARGLLDIEAY